MMKEHPSIEALEEKINVLTSHLNQKTQELSVITAVQEGLAKKLEIQHIYDLIGGKIKDVFDAQGVIIATFDHEVDAEIFKYAIEKDERVFPDARPLDRLRKQLISSRKTIQVKDAEESYSWFKQKTLPGTQTLQSGVFVPFITDDIVLGYISLQNVDRSHAFSDSDVQLLETLAHSMSLALENAKLFDETNRLLKETEQGKAELAVINSVQEGLVREMDIQGIYKLVGNRIRDLFNAQVVVIATFDLENRMEFFNYHIEKGEVSFPKPRPFDKVRKHLIETGQNILINSNVEQAVAEFGMKVVPGTEMPKSMLFMPLKVGDKVTGYVSLQNIDEENAFSFSDVRLLSTLANSMSVALQNAKLFDETNRLLKETEQQKGELAVINSVQDGLAREMDMKAIYQLVGERLRLLFPDSQVLVIRTFDHEDQLEHFQYVIEKGQRFYVDPHPFNWANLIVMTTKKSFVLNEKFLETAKKFGQTGVVKGEPPKSAVFVPLMVGDVVKGTVSLQNIDREQAFSDSDVRLLETLANSMSVALENARLFDETTRLLKETEQRTAELALINSVQEGLAKELNIQGIYELVGEKIREIFDAQVVDIVTYDRASNQLQDMYAFEKGDRTLVGTFEPNGFRKKVIHSKKTLIINSGLDEKSIESDSKVIHGEVPKSGVWVPLISGNEVKGMISLQDLDKENAFSESNVRLLETLANSMSVALENARLFDETNRLLKETEQRNAELAVINSVQESLVAQINMDSIYELVGEKMREIFKVQVIDIVTYDSNRNVIEDRYSYEKGDTTRLGAREPKGFRKYVIESGELLLHNENVEAEAKRFDNPILIGEMPKSQIYVPMVAGGKVTGVISLQNLDHEHAFSESDVSLLTTLTNSMSVALESARLFDETNRLLKETEQRNAELAVINSVQESLVAQINMDSIYELVGEKMREIFKVQVIDIVTYDSNRNVIEDRYAYEKGDTTRLGPREPKGFRKHVIESGELVLHNENVEAETVRFDNPILIGEMPKSQIYVPMVAGGKVTGVISLQNLDHEHAFSDSDVSLLTTLTNSMSVALESARLFDETNRLLKETEQRTAELAVINSVQEGLAHELDVQGIYTLVGDRIEKLFQTHAVIIATFDLEKGIEQFHYAFENGQRYQFDSRPIVGLRKKLIESKEIIYIETEATARDVYGITAIGDTKMPKSLMFVPLLSGNTIKGYISIQNVDKEHAFSNSEIRLLETLGNSMSVALENARLFAETTRLLSEAKQRATELSTVNNISKAIASQLNANELIQFVGDEMKELFRANIVYLALLDQKTRMIHFKYQFGEVMDSRLVGEGLTSKIILSGESLLINKEVEEKTKEMGIKSMGVTAASYLGVPIPVGDDIIGVLSVQSTEQENRFNENDQRLLSTIAASVGVALSNAKLFEDVQLAQKEAEAASRAAEKANEAKSAFLSTVSHELRTPLTSVLGFAKIIRKRLDEKIFPTIDKSDPKIEKTIRQITENLQVVVSEGERLTHLINDVLDLAKIEAGKMEWNLEDVSLTEVAERAISATTALFDQKRLRLEKDIQADLPLISGDRDKLIQVIINLISNAVKFTDKGTVGCKVRSSETEIVVSISDTGIGISPEDFAAVFEQFKQVGGDTLTDKPKGTGLGLPICKEIVEHHGGRIWLDSSVGKGSVFSFAIPINKRQPKKSKDLDILFQQLKDQMSQSRLGELHKNATILIVDDDDSIRSLLQQELSDAGYLIQQAVNGRTALESVRMSKPDLIILDVMMPEMNGFDVAAVLKNDPDTMDIPIIILSIVQDKIRGYKIGVDRYLNKPIDTTVLFTEVGALLEQGKSKKKVMVVDEDTTALRTLTDVLQTKGYHVVESDEKGLLQQAILNKPDIIILNSTGNDKQEMMQAVRYEKGLENVLFLYQ